MANWSWEGCKERISAASQTPIARFIYSLCTGIGVAGSILYIKSSLPLYFNPSLIFLVAATACTITTVVRYHQLSVNDDRIGKLEKKALADEILINHLKDKVKSLTLTSQEWSLATENNMHALDILIPSLPEEVREQCLEAMKPPREEKGVFIKQYPQVLDTLRVNETELNPYSQYFHRAAPTLVQSDDENEADLILSKSLEQIKIQLSS